MKCRALEADAAFSTAVSLYARQGQAAECIKSFSSPVSRSRMDIFGIPKLPAILANLPSPSVEAPTPVI